MKKPLVSQTQPLPAPKRSRPTLQSKIDKLNVTVKLLEDTLDKIASYLGCSTDQIFEALLETQVWKTGWTQATSALDKLHCEMGDTIKAEVDKKTFNLQLTNKKLELEVDRLTKILDNQKHETSRVQLKKNIPTKGFWDFLYKIFNLS